MNLMMIIFSILTWSSCSYLLLVLSFFGNGSLSILRINSIVRILRKRKDSMILRCSYLSIGLSLWHSRTSLIDLILSILSTF